MPSVQVKDYYQMLGVPRTASEKEIRSAYRKLARQHHPDLNPGDKNAEDRFKEVNEAHEVLTDADKRKLYDRFGEDWQRYRDAGFTGSEPSGRAGAAPFGRVDPNDFGAWYSSQRSRSSSSTQSEDWTVFEVRGDDDGNGFSDFFQTLFGGKRNRTGRGGFTTAAPTRRRGQDVEVGVDVSFDEAVRGASRAFELQTPQPCPTCHGTGLARDVTCPTCDGTGAVPRAKTIEVRIPPGVATGSRVRAAGQGGPGLHGGPNGDAYLRLTVRPDPRFERSGDDLRTDVDVPLYTALLGGEVVVPTPTGRVALTIPPETQPGRVFRLRHQGMPRLKGGVGERGDLLARARLILPINLTDRERSLVEDLRSLRDQGHESTPSTANQARPPRPSPGGTS